MNNAWKIITGIAIGGLLIAFLYSQHRINGLTKDNQIQAVQIMAINDTAKVYRDKSGETYEILKSEIIQNNALKGSLDALGINARKLTDKNIKLSNLVQLLQGQIEAEGHVSTPLKDTIRTEPGKINTPVKTFNWSNKYLFLWGDISPKSMEADYIYKTGITSTTEQIKKKSIITVFLTDPHARILTGSQIIIEPVKHWWDHWYLYVLAGTAIGVYISK